MTNKLIFNITVIEPAYNLITLLYNSTKSKSVIYSDEITRWIKNNMELYNNRNEFIYLLLIKSPSNEVEYQIANSNYKQNYLKMKEELNNLNKPTGFISTNPFVVGSKTNTSIEADNYIIKNNIFRLITFIVQYLHVLEENSIDENVWNYCLVSATFSLKYTLIGIITITCQIMWTTLLIHNVVDNYEINTDISIILITIMSTIMSIIYSYTAVSSLYKSISLYKFIIRLYSDYPDLVLNKKEYLYRCFKERNITMTKNIIKYNLVLDCISNGIIPLIIPFINVFIIINSQDVTEAILNSIAIFFITQLDEDLYKISDYTKNKETMVFMRWIISSVYYKHFPSDNPIFRMEQSLCNERNLNNIRGKKNKVHPT